MPLIPDEWIERIKHEVLLPLLAERTGVELKKVGQELMGRCPFPPHEDSTPSLSINQARNVFQCFGCGVAGTSIDWVMREKSVDFRGAVELLLWDFFPSAARELLGEPRRERQMTRRSRAPELPCPFQLDGEDQQLLNEYADFCHALFKETAEPQDYVRKRGLDSAELVSRFKLGYQDRSLGLRLPTNITKAGRQVRERFQRLGLLREQTGHAHFNGSLVIPTIDPAGNVTGIYGRKTRNDLNKHSSPKHLYLPGPDQDVFNEEALGSSKEIVLCESRIDALTFWRHDIRNVTASRGAGNLSAALLDAFVRHGVTRCFIAFDRDEAGDAGALKAAEKLIAVGIECYRVHFPRGMDANEVSLKMTPAKKNLELFLRSAEWMGSGRRPPHGDIDIPAQSEPTTSAITGEDRALDVGALDVAAATAAPEAAHEAPTSAAEASSSDELPMDPGETASSPAEATEEAIARAAEERSFSSTPLASPLQVSAPVQPSPPAPPPSPPVPLPTSKPIVGLIQATDDEALFAFEDRRYRVFGLAKCHSLSALPITLKAKREGVDFSPPCPIAGWHMDKLDLVASRQRDLFEKRTAHELGVKEEVVRRDLGLVLGGLETLQEERVRKLLEPKVKTPEMTDKEREEALSFWRTPGLLSRILEHFTACGLVGEATNKLVCYIAAVSRLLDRPLAIIIQSSSAAGKTALMDALLSLMPEESFEKYTAVSGKGLFYFDEDTSLRHKVLAIVEEEGAEKATYPLKLLHSEGELRMASTGKDPQTGRLVTQLYKVEGPVMIILTTTAIELDPELENRCLRLTVDESREQTRLIHELQRKRLTLEGLIAQKRKAKIRALHQNAHRLLRPLKVLNPYEPYLTFVDDQTRTRRDHEKYLTIIEALALMHQHQRPAVVEDVDGEMTECVKVTLSDIEIANRLAGEVLGRTLDELPPQTRRFLTVLHQKVTEICEREGVEQRDLRFSRRDVRRLTGWTDFQVRIHLGRLVELEYVLVHHGARGQSFVYELLYAGEGKDGASFVLGLVDVEMLRQKEREGLAEAPTPTPIVSTTSSLRGLEGGFEGSLSPQSAPIERLFSPLSIASATAPAVAFSDSDITSAENSLPGTAVRTRPTRRASRRAPVNGTSQPRLLVNLLKHPPLAVPVEVVDLAQLPPKRGPHELSDEHARRYALRRAMGQG